MALPEKHYFSIDEIATRWNAPLRDLHYYAEHGLLEMQVWLDDVVVKNFRLVKTENGEKVPAQIFVSSHKGYAALHAEDLRRIFKRSEPPRIARFRVNDNIEEWIEIFDSKVRVFISSGELVISRIERDRFETVYSIDKTECCCGHVGAAAQTPSFSGRPSTMYRVLARFKERCETGDVHASLLKEATYLADWAAQSIGDAQSPKAKTIMNALREEYRRFRDDEQAKTHAA